jgi:hypothetical protein
MERSGRNNQNAVLDDEFFGSGQAEIRWIGVRSSVFFKNGAPVTKIAARREWDDLDSA